MTRIGSFGRLGMLLSILVLPGGCGPATSTVAGTVTLDGNPVPEGTISFLMEDGTVHTAFIEAGGAYRVEMVPVGKALVTVLTKQTGAETNGEDIKNQKASGPPKVDAPKVIIPSKYSSPDTSGLTCQVQGSTTKFDVPLTK